MKNFTLSIYKSWGTYIGHQHHNTPECDVGDWYLIRCLTLDVSDVTCHQRQNFVTNTFGLQHPSPTSLSSQWSCDASFFHFQKRIISKLIFQYIMNTDYVSRRYIKKPSCNIWVVKLVENENYDIGRFVKKYSHEVWFNFSVYQHIICKYYWTWGDAK